jgi:hypothetical protein
MSRCALNLLSVLDLTSFAFGITAVVRLGRKPSSWLAGHRSPKLKQHPKGAVLVFVAGPGIEPGSGGYEPPEVPLLYPAVYLKKVW